MRLGKSIITRIIQIMIIILVMIIMMIVYKNTIQKEEIQTEEDIENAKKQAIFEMIESSYAYMDKYTIYGNHLNIGGYIDIENIPVDKLKITVMDLDKNEVEYDLVYNEEENRVYYTISDNINEGINLENINSGKYYIFLKMYIQNEEKEEIKYYSIKNETDYSDTEYYTLTCNNQNLKIDIDISTYNELEYIGLIATDTCLPQDVYDIVIDPGHGGKDPGAMYGDEYEAYYTLELAFLLKEKLESIGYKVKLTRTEDVYVEAYGEDGRAVIPYKAKAKLFLSLHLNSTEENNNNGGVEIYTASDMNLDMAKSFADNIVSSVGCNYSTNKISKVLDGVYVKTYTQEDIIEAIEYAEELGYEPYENISTKTPYYFMIRETGGIMTHAYIDGRNTNIGANPYYNSNIAAEAYLLELGFINSKFDLENIKNNQNAYIDAIVETIVDNYSN